MNADESVRSLQRMLRLLSAADPKIPSVIPDGHFGSETEAAVRAVQQQADLPCTGVVDAATWDAIAQRCDAAAVQLGPAHPLEILLQQEVPPKGRNLHLLMMKSMFMALRETYPDIPAQTVGSMESDAPFCDAIRWLQTACGQEPNGTLCKNCWRMLARLYRVTIRNG